MIYFSELRGKKVYTEDHINVGKLDDLIFLVAETAKVTKFIVRDKFKNTSFIPTDYIKEINEEIIIKKAYTTVSLEENELYVLRNLLDKQIIDLIGNKIVRVNDVAFQKKILQGFELYVTGVDVSLLGILRWFKLEYLVFKIINFFNLKISSRFLSWGDIAPLELVRGRVKLRKKEEKLQKIRPEDLADYLERTNVINAGKFLKMLDERHTAEVISNLNLNYQAELFRHYKAEKAAKLLSYIDPDDIVDILVTLPQKKREEIMAFFPEKMKEEIGHLLHLSTTPIGKLLTTEFITVYPNDLVRKVIDKIKKETKDFSFLTPIFVINDDKQLIGVFNLHELILQDLDTPVYKFMIQNVIVARLTTPFEIALSKMLKYKLAALPVVNGEKQMLGMITVVDLYELFLRKIK